MSAREKPIDDGIGNEACPLQGQGSCQEEGEQAELRLTAEETRELVFSACLDLLRARLKGMRLHLQGADEEDIIPEAGKELARRLAEPRACALSAEELQCWLGCVLASKVANFFRHKQRHPTGRRMEDLVGTAEEPAERQEGPVYTAETHEECERLLATVAELRGGPDDLNFRILWMRHIEGLDTAAVAGMLGLPREEVADRLRRGKEKLRRHLGGEVRRQT